MPVIVHNLKARIVLQKLEKKGIKLKDTSSLDYILFGIPPSDEWDYISESIREILKKV